MKLRPTRFVITVSAAALVLGLTACSGGTGESAASKRMLSRPRRASAGVAAPMRSARKVSMVMKRMLKEKIEMVRPKKSYFRWTMMITLVTMLVIEKKGWTTA